MSRSTFLAPLLVFGLLGCAAGMKSPAQVKERHGPADRTFDMVGTQGHHLFIWDMHPVESGMLDQAVGEALQELGFHRATGGSADFLVNVQAFAADRKPGTLTIVVECLDPGRNQRVYIGQVDLEGEHRVLDLKEFLSALPQDRAFVRFLEHSRGDQHT